MKEIWNSMPFLINVKDSQSIKKGKIIKKTKKYIWKAITEKIPYDGTTKLGVIKLKLK